MKTTRMGPILLAIHYSETVNGCLQGNKIFDKIRIAFSKTSPKSHGVKLGFMKCIILEMSSSDLK